MRRPRLSQPIPRAAALCAGYRCGSRNGDGNGGLNVPLRQFGVKGVAVGNQAGQGCLLHQGLTRSVAPSGSALLSPRPYRDMNAHAVGFMTIYQVMWMFDFSQIQASATLQRTQETMCVLVAACRHAPPVCEPNRCRVTRGIGPVGMRKPPGYDRAREPLSACTGYPARPDAWIPPVGHRLDSSSPSRSGQGAPHCPIQPGGVAIGQGTLGRITAGLQDVQPVSTQP